MTRHVRQPKYNIDWLRVVLLFIGTSLFIYGGRLAWIDGSDDFHMAGMGVLGSVLAGAGVALLYISRLV